MEKIIKLCNIFHCKINDLVHENMVDIDSLDEEIKMSVVKFKDEKQKKIKGISKAIYIIARVGKIIAAISIPIVIFLLITSPIFINNIEIEDNTIIYKGSKISDKITITQENLSDGMILKVKVNDVTVAMQKNQIMILKLKSILENTPKWRIITYVEFGLACLLICLGLYILILNKLEKLFININHGDTPFTLENVKYIKDIAKIMIFALALPSIGGIIFEKILSTDLDVGFELFDIVQILFLFGISYIFEYGYELQLDSKCKMYGNENE